MDVSSARSSTATCGTVFATLLDAVLATTDLFQSICKRVRRSTIYSGSQSPLCAGKIRMVQPTSQIQLSKP
jgi:hypothetical protein